MNDVQPLYQLQNNRDPYAALHIKGAVKEDQDAETLYEPLFHAAKLTGLPITIVIDDQMLSESLAKIHNISYTYNKQSEIEDWLACYILLTYFQSIAPSLTLAFLLIF